MVGQVQTRVHLKQRNFYGFRACIYFEVYLAANRKLNNFIYFLLEPVQALKKITQRYFVKVHQHGGRSGRFMGCATRWPPHNSQ